jgi:hypothetical protein
MKTHVLRTSIVAMLLAVAGHAQSTLPLNATIPFNFVAGGTTLNAGKYRVEQDTSGVIQVKSVDGKGHTFLFTVTGRCAGNQEASRLVFNRYGDTYLLSQIWTRGSNCDRLVPPDARERELAAGRKAADDTIIVALR